MLLGWILLATSFKTIQLLCSRYPTQWMLMTSTLSIRCKCKLRQCRGRSTKGTASFLICIRRCKRGGPPRTHQRSFLSFHLRNSKASRTKLLKKGKRASKSIWMNCYCISTYSRTTMCVISSRWRTRKWCGSILKTYMITKIMFTRWAAIKFQMSLRSLGVPLQKTLSLARETSLEIRVQSKWCHLLEITLRQVFPLLHPRSSQILRVNRKSSNY